MRRTYAWRNGQLVELTPQEIAALPQVMDDVPDFRSPDGARIRGRAQWREHLKRTGTVEMGHSDLKIAQENWQKKRAAFAEKTSQISHDVRPVEPPDGEIRERRSTEVDKALANRLYNRPMPGRKLLVKLALETAREIAKRK